MTGSIRSSTPLGEQVAERGGCRGDNWRHPARGWPSSNSSHYFYSELPAQYTRR